MYNVVISKTVSKYLAKLPEPLASQFYSQINHLRIDKTGYRCIGKDGPYELRELRLASHRVYYLVENGIIFVDLIKYYGRINVAKAGTKDQQKRHIGQLKKEHGLREENRAYKKKAKRMTAAQKDDLMDLMIGRAFRMRNSGDYLTIEQLKKRLKL